MDNYSIALLESADKYLSDLKSYGKNTNKTLKDLMMYTIIYDLYQSVDWNEWGELTKLTLQKKLNSILLNNNELVKLKSNSGYIPVNINIEQDIYTWRSIFIFNTDLKTT